MIRKTVFITGASKGIGKQIAVTFARNGYNIAGCYNKTKPFDLVDSIKEYNIDYKTYKLDITSAYDVNNTILMALNDFGTIDVLVNNAGVALERKLLIDTTQEEFKNTFLTNVEGTYLVTKEMLKYFIKAGKGSIINISSILGTNGGSCETIYSASKAAIIGLTKSLAKEVGEYGIRVNALAPGFINTDMTKGFSNEDKEDLLRQTALSKLGTTEDVASAALFLASDAAKFITGQIIGIDGGLLI